MKTKISLFLVLLVLNSLTWAQTRTGTGPDDVSDDLVQNFLSSVNKKSKDCLGEKTDFKSLSDLKLHYSIAETLEKNADPSCVEGAIPKKFSCLLNGQANSDLVRLVKDPNHVQILKVHARVYKIPDTEIDSVTSFLYELDRKLNHEERK